MGVLHLQLVLQGRHKKLATSGVTQLDALLCNHTLTLSADGCEERTAQVALTKAGQHNCH